MRKSVIIRPDFYPSDRYEIHGRREDNETKYTITRKIPRATLPLLLLIDAPEHEDFDKYFSECLGREEEP